ncbi:MAG: tail fiber protein [Rhodospirillales bacterium]|nr:tail fiber protein [Rhodospirillales bacterium]
MGPDSYIATMSCTAATFAPRDTAFCYGQLVLIDDYQALYSLISNTFGGDGRQTFGLPDMRGRTAVGTGQGPGLTDVLRGQLRGTETSIVPLPEHYHEAVFTPSGSAGTYPVTGTITSEAGVISSNANLNIATSTLSGTASINGTAPVTGTTPVTLNGNAYVNNNNGALAVPQNNGALARPNVAGNPVDIFDTAPSSGEVAAGHVSVSGDVPSTGKTVDGSAFNVDTSGLSVSLTGYAATAGLNVEVPDPDFNLNVDISSAAGGTVSVSNAGTSNATINKLPPQLGLNWIIMVDGIYPPRP